MQPNTPQQPNTLGNASLGLGLASAALVFGIGLCALSGARQGWIGPFATPLFVCGTSSAFLGVLGALVGGGGLLGRNRTRATAAVGVALSLIGVCLYLAILASLRQG
jgi:hypothetical protein